LITHIGFDDTDSPRGGCTTYVATVLAQKLLELGAKFIDYPNLIRLNPNTPWKTRGNAAVCLRFDILDEKESRVKESILDLIEQYGEFWCKNTNPGVVFLRGEVPFEIKEFSNKTVRQIVKLDEAEELIQRYGLHAVGWKNRRGIIGGLAAVGGTLETDHTYELVTYRSPDNWGQKRRLNLNSIREMDRKLSNSTFNNITKKGNSIIAPHGPDPVLYGVRGESPEAVFKAYCIIEELEPVERWMIYRSNQGTNAHFSEPIKINELKPYNPAVFEGKVVYVPETIQGGHVIFQLEDSSGFIDCAVYEPAGDLRHLVWGLISSDHLRVYGGVKPRGEAYTLNIETIEVISLAQKIEYVNPSCPECGGSMESMGKHQGYRCKKCKYLGNRLTKIPMIHPRKIKPGVYLPDRDAQRHLTKPLKRYGKEKKGTPQVIFKPWIGGRSERINTSKTPQLQFV
jgi:tRNA(Ile2)-agmatinylcytidine synthase